MAFEVIRGEDLRIVFSKLAQSAYGTPLTDANLNSGKSFRLDAATLGEIMIAARAESGPKPMTGHEFNVAGEERDLLRSSEISLSCPANSWLAAWAFAFIMGADTVAQEAATTHYTHTCKFRDPLAASGVRQARVTSLYVDSGSADASRLRRKWQDLAFRSVTLSGGPGGENAKLAIDLVGSGVELSAPTITIPALEVFGGSTSMLLQNQGAKLEYGTKGGALTDISERLRDWEFTIVQNLAEDQGYFPGSGKVRQRMWHLTRQARLRMSLYVSRANRDLVDDMLNMTEKEIKLSLISGTRAGTSTTTDHQIITRLPDVRLSEVPISFDDAGAVYGVQVAENQIYKDAAIADSPVTVIVDNTETSMFA